EVFRWLLAEFNEQIDRRFASGQNVIRHELHVGKEIELRWFWHDQRPSAIIRPPVMLPPLELIILAAFMGSVLPINRRFSVVCVSPCIQGGVPLPLFVTNITPDLGPDDPVECRLGAAALN